MKVGIDLDGVVFNSENYISAFVELKYMDQIRDDELNFKSNSTKNRYHISSANFEELLKVYESSIMKCPLMPYVKEAIDFLKSRGHRLYIITARGKYGEKHIALTKKRLKKEKIEVDEYHFAQTEKTSICKSLNLDLMIDDGYEVVSGLSKNGIKCFQFISDRTEKVRHKNVEYVYNWGEICRKIEEKKKEIVEEKNKYVNA